MMRRRAVWKRRLAIVVRRRSSWAGALALLIVYCVAAYHVLGYFASQSPATEQQLHALDFNEAVVSDEAFFKCVWDRLAAASSADPRTVVPLAIIPVTLEVVGFKGFMCNITAPIERLFLIHNGFADEMRVLVDGLQERIAKWDGENGIAAVVSDHLIIRRHPENLGYAPSVNEGFRHLLHEMPTAPFAAVFNVDVRFSREYLERYTQTVWEATAYDDVKIDELTALVKAEDQFKPGIDDDEGGRRRPSLRSRKLPGVSMAALLPDSIRFAPRQMQRKAFTNHTAMFYFTTKEFNMCAFMVSRLALLAVGLFDENCYPAYFEDIDWMYRVPYLGFKSFLPPSENGFGTFQHLGSLNLRDALRAANGDPRSPSYVKQANMIRRMCSARPDHDYGYTKWQWKMGEWDHRFPKPFAQLPFNVPIDVWIVDLERRAMVTRVGNQPASEPVVSLHDTYNLSLLEVLRYV